MCIKQHIYYKYTNMHNKSMNLNCFLGSAYKIVYIRLKTLTFHFVNMYSTKDEIIKSLIHLNIHFLY